MKKLYFYEWKKLFRQGSFLFFTIILLLGNLLMLFQYEKGNSSYVYFYQQKEEWEKYKMGDDSIQNAAVYQSFIEQEENYVSSYEVFLKQIPEQAETLKKTAKYQNTNTYLYRNLIKTVSDYEKLSAKGIKAETSIGIKELASYNYGIYFQIIFSFVLSYFIVSTERKKGLFLLTKGTKKGHSPFAGAKILTVISASALYGILQECSVFSFLGYLYGYGDITRSIQSVSIFRDCSLSLTIAQAIVGLFAIRIGIGILCAVLIVSLTICFRREGVGAMFYASILGIQLYFNHSIEMSSSMNIIKCLTIFFNWDMKHVFGIYQNLHLFGYPVNKLTFALTAGGVFFCILVIVSLYRFSASCQISAGNLLEDIREKIASKVSFQWHHTSVYRFEFRKVFFQQKKGILLVIMLIWCIFSVREVMEPVYYDNPQDGEYHRILSQISGPVTDESLQYLSDQRMEIDAMYKEVEALANDTEEFAEIKSDALHHQISIREDGLAQVEEQRDMLQEKTGNMYEKYWVDEKNYISIFQDYKYDLCVFFIGSIVLVLWICDMEASDNRKGLYPLLCTTKTGKKQIQKKKKQVCITGMLYCMLCMLIPQFLRYYKIDHFENIGQKLSDFTSVGFQVPISLGCFLVLLVLVKMVAFFFFCEIMIMLIRKVHNTAIVIGAGIGSVGMVVLLLWYFHMDLTVLLMRMLCGNW